jgi:hypothetical protein
MSRPGQIRGVFLGVIAIPALFVVVAMLQTRIDAKTRAIAREKEELLLTSGPVLKEVSLDYAPLLADIYWTRAVQYYGGWVGKPDAKFELLWPLLDVTTTLDPKLIIAYRFGAIFLSEPQPIGAGRPDLGVELVQRGIRENPSEWILGTDLGFMYFWYLHDYNDSANAYLETSKNSEAPEWVRIMAARMADRGDALDTSKMVWAGIYRSTTNKSIRTQALQHLQGLKAIDDERHLDTMIEAFRKLHGRNPDSIEQLREDGFVAGIPLDPSGFPYRIGKDGKTELDPRSPVQTQLVPSDAIVPPPISARQ